MSTSNAPRRYFSARAIGGRAVTPIDLETMKALFLNAYEHFQSNGYLDESFGSYCVDAGHTEGTIGSAVDSFVHFELMKVNLWPIKENIDGYTESDLFDMIEFLYDHVSCPRQKDWHGWDNCGYHYSDFDSALGRKDYRERINKLLERYGATYELNERGEIMELAPAGVGQLLSAKLPTKDVTVTGKVRNAIERFRRYGSSMDERQNAVRDLADVLEWLRPQIKITLLKADEQELFRLANNFGIRHLRQDQKLDYDRAVWLSWMFYHYLATINACLHLIERQRRQPTNVN